MLKVSAIYKGTNISIIHGDITKQIVDCIVNAANRRLAHGAGVAGAIIKNGGFSIQDESNDFINKHGQLRTGEVGWTSGGKLKCKCIIHAVGPVYDSSRRDNNELLRNAVYNSLAKAEEFKLNSIAIPAISSGIFGFPKNICAQIMMQTTKEFLDTRRIELKDIRYVNFDQSTCDIFINQFNKEFNLEETKKINNTQEKSIKDEEKSGGGVINDKEIINDKAIVEDIKKLSINNEEIKEEPKNSEIIQKRSESGRPRYPISPNTQPKKPTVSNQHQQVIIPSNAQFKNQTVSKQYQQVSDKHPQKNFNAILGARNNVKSKK